MTPTETDILSRAQAIQQEAEEKLAKVTPGEWSYEVREYSPDYVFAGRQAVAHAIGDSAETEANADFIAASPRLVRDLLALSIAQQEQIAQLTGEQATGIDLATDTETGVVYQVIGRQTSNGREWVNLALPAEPRERVRSVSAGLFEDIFKPFPTAEDR